MNLAELVDALHDAEQSHADARRDADEMKSNAWRAVMEARQALMDAMVEAGTSSAASEHATATMREVVSARVDRSVDPEVVAAGLEDVGLGEIVGRNAVVLPHYQTLQAQIRRLRERMVADGDDPDELTIPGVNIKAVVLPKVTER